MWRAAAGRLAIGGALIGVLGGIAGLGLSNFVDSGAFQFYSRPQMAEAVAMADLIAEAPERPRARFDR